MGGEGEEGRGIGRRIVVVGIGGIGMEVRVGTGEGRTERDGETNVGHVDYFDFPGGRGGGGEGVTLPSNIYNVLFCDISLISRE
jgi:hypothetical protein